MAESQTIVAVDSCILIEAVHLRRRFPDYPSVELFDHFTRKTFILLLVQNVETEARDALKGYGEEAELDGLLKACDLVRCPNAASEQIESMLQLLLPYLRHLNDLPIAVSLMYSSPQPDVFLSSNRRHWKPSLSAVLGGIDVATPRQFLSRLGL